MCLTGFAAASTRRSPSGRECVVGGAVIVALMVGGVVAFAKEPGLMRQLGRGKKHRPAQLMQASYRRRALRACWPMVRTKPGAAVTRARRARD